jgi:hypothetical protein
MAIDNQYDGEVVDGATKFQKREIAVSKRSTDKPKAHRRQPTETRTDKSTKLKSTKKSTRILLKPPVESATLKSTGWSPKRTSKNDYRVKQHLRVNATYR